MPSKRAQRSTRGMEAPAPIPPPQHYGALSLDKGLSPPEEHPNFSFGISSSSSTSSSLVNTPHQAPRARSESPDLALLGAVLPSPPRRTTSESPDGSAGDGTTLGAKTFNAKADMPKWMEEVTSGFSKEVSLLMGEMDDLRREKAKIQMEIATLMGTLSQYSPGGQFAPPPRWGQPVTPEPPHQLEPGSPPDTVALVHQPPAPAKPGWRTVKPQPKKIQSKVVHNPTPKALPAPPTPQVQYPQVTPPVMSAVPTHAKLPTWTTWKPQSRSTSSQSISSAKGPAAKPPVVPPTLFGE